MAAYDILPTTNLTGDDIRDTLNAHGGSVANAFSSYFSSAANINKWSKYKPVIYASNFVDSDYRWKGDGNCGFTIPTSSNYTDIPNWYGDVVGMNGWVYNRPTGGSAAPMRLGDFRGYCALSYPLTQGFYAPEYGGRGIGDSILCTCMTNPESDIALTIADIDTIANCYFGVIAINQSNPSNYRMAWASTKGSTSVELDTSGLAPTTWKLYPFFCNKNVHESGTKYYPVPNVAPRTVEIVTSIESVQIQITGLVDESTKTCSYSILAKNTGSATTISNNHVYMKYDGNDLSDDTAPGEKYTSINSISVPTSDSYQRVYSGTFVNLDADLISSGKLWVTMGTGKYVASVYPMKSPSGQISE